MKKKIMYFKTIYAFLALSFFFKKRFDYYYLHFKFLEYFSIFFLKKLNF